MNYAHDTALLCFLGWLAHWLFSWWECYKVRKCSLLDFIDDSPPAFWFSVVSTVAVYLVGPVAVSYAGIQMPSDQSAALLVSFAIGYMSDSIIYKIANISRNS